MELSDITVLDFETSGLHPARDRVIEIAAVRCHEGRIVSRYSTLVRFEGSLPPKVTELTGLTSADLENGMDEETALRILNRFIGSNVIVAHNAAFDLGFLHYALMRHAGRSFSNRFLDTLTICRDRQPYPHSLGEMCKRYGVELDGAHRALADVEACWELLKKLNEESSVEPYVNRLGYLPKYGPPSWYPPQAELQAAKIRYA